MTSEDYDGFRVFLEEACGIMLGDNKHYLVSSRLSPLLAEAGLPSLRELLVCLKTGTDVRLRDRVIDAMTTNVPRPCQGGQGGYQGVRLNFVMGPDKNKIQLFLTTPGQDLINNVNIINITIPIGPWNSGNSDYSIKIYDLLLLATGLPDVKEPVTLDKVEFEQQLLCNSWNDTYQQHMEVDYIRVMDR